MPLLRPTQVPHDIGFDWIRLVICTLQCHSHIYEMCNMEVPTFQHNKPDKKKRWEMEGEGVSRQAKRVVEAGTWPLRAEVGSKRVALHWECNSIIEGITAGHSGAIEDITAALAVEHRQWV